MRSFFINREFADLGNDVVSACMGHRPLVSV